MDSGLGPAARPGMTEQRRLLIRVFGEHRRDAAAPGAVKFLQQLLGRCDAAGDELLQRTQITRLVVAVGIEPGAARQSLARQPQRNGREIEHALAADLRLEAEPRHVVAQLLPFVRGPVLHDLPAGVERRVVIENADPVGRQRRQPPPGAAVGAAHFEITLEPHLGKDRRDVVRPIGDGGAFARQ